jgi:thiamine-phosphate pyrophosphorylase
VDAAERSTADYLGVGPVHETPTKPGRAVVGLELVRHASASTAKPFFAIGGIDPARAPAVIAAGARRIAVVRAICDAEDPAAATSELLAAIEARDGAVV